jgi:SHS2 domain-containing protein
VRYRLPSPHAELAHTADVGVVVRGQDLAETYCRAALAMAQLQTGGGALTAEEERSIRAHGEDQASLLVDLCRQVLRAFHLDRRILAALEIDSLTSTDLVARGEFGRFDPDRHGEGMDLKAVTYARASVVPRAEGGFEASLIFDI